MQVAEQVPEPARRPWLDRSRTSASNAWCVCDQVAPSRSRNPARNADLRSWREVGVPAANDRSHGDVVPSMLAIWSRTRVDGTPSTWCTASSKSGRAELKKSGMNRPGRISSASGRICGSSRRSQLPLCTVNTSSYIGSGADANRVRARSSNSKRIVSPRPFGTGSDNTIGICFPRSATTSDGTQISLSGVSAFPPDNVQWTNSGGQCGQCGGFQQQVTDVIAFLSDSQPRHRRSTNVTPSSARECPNVSLDAVAEEGRKAAVVHPVSMIDVMLLRKPAFSDVFASGHNFSY